VFVAIIALGQDKARRAWQDRRSPGPDIRSMHQLLLLRHAKSSWDDAALPDRDRPLNKRGRRAAAAMRQAMQGLGLVPDLVLVSPARRAQETLASLEPWDETPLIEPVESLYLATAPQLLSVLQDVNETVRGVLLIGHNPGLHELAVLLAGTQLATAGEMAQRVAAGFPTAALAEFSIATPWQQLAAGGGRLMRFLAPRDLRHGELPESPA
jgi:phosphohistidine phosphatase